MSLSNAIGFQFITQFCGLMIFLMILGMIGSKPRIRNHFLRGTRLSTLWQVKSRLMKYQDRPDTFVWGRFKLPLSIANKNLLVAGTVGSGKTIILRLMMQSVLPKITPGSGSRALIFDGKGELTNVVLGMAGAEQSVITLDSGDAEGARWDIAKDVCDDATAHLVASLLFPTRDGESQPFFPESIQTLARAVMEVLTEKAYGKWRLSHLLYILRSEARLEKVLSMTERGRETWEMFAGSGETFANIRATLANRIAEYEIVASLWDQAPNAVSVRDWNAGESILILRRSQTYTTVVDAINRVVFTLAKKRLLDTPETPTRRTWIILDEAANLGGGKLMVEEIKSLMEMGRSFNICVALGFQSIPGLHATYGKDNADALVDLASTKAMLRFSDARSSEWGAGQCGKQEVRVESTTTSSSGGSGSSSSSTSTSSQYQERWVVLPSEFQATPQAGPEQGVTGHFIVPEGNVPLLFRDTLPPKWLFGAKGLAPVSKRVVPPRDPSMQRSQVTEADIDALLGLAPSAPQPAQSAKPVAAGGGGSGTVVTPPVTAPPVTAPPVTAPPVTAPPLHPPAAQVPVAQVAVAQVAVPHVKAKPQQPAKSNAPNAKTNARTRLTGANLKRNAGRATGVAATTPTTAASQQSLVAASAAAPAQVVSPSGAGAAGTASAPATTPTSEPPIWNLKTQTVTKPSLWNVGRAST